MDSFEWSYSVLLQVLLLVCLCVLQIFVDSGNLPLFIIDGLVQGLQLLFYPLVPVFLRGKLTATALLSIQVSPLLCSLGQSGIKQQPLKLPKQKEATQMRLLIHT